MCISDWANARSIQQTCALIAKHVITGVLRSAGLKCSAEKRRKDHHRGASLTAACTCNSVDGSRGIGRVSNLPMTKQLKK